MESYAAENLLQEQAEHDGFTLTRYQQFCRYIPNGPVSLLDIGCSTGRGGVVIAESRPDVTIWGLDVVQSRLDALPEVYKHRIRGVSTNIPMDDSSVDVVVAGEFLEHLKPGDVDPTLFEFHRVLRIGGTLVMTTPNPRSALLRIRNGTVYEPGHLTQHFAQVLRLRLMMHGFNHVAVRGTGRSSKYVGTRIPILRLYGSYLIRAIKI